MISPDATTRLNEAARCYGQGELVRAEAICSALLREYPQAVDVLHLLALVLKRKGDAAGAGELFARCVQLAPGRADIRANLGNLLNAEGRLAEAAAAYRQALSLDPQFRPAHLGLARTLLRAGKYDQALREAEALTARDDRDAEAWTISGTALRSLGDQEEAEASFRCALRHNPGNAVARHNLGALLNQMGCSEEALVELGKAAEAGIFGSEIEHNIASALMGLNRFDDAEVRLARAVAAMPRDVRTQRLLARLRFMRGADDYAASLKRAVARFPGDVVLRVTLSQLLRGAGSPDAAAETLLGAPNPADPRLRAELAAVYQEAGRFESSCAAAGEAIAADPGNVEFSDLLMDSLLALGRADEVIPLVEAARRRQPLNQWYIAVEATAARLLGDPRYERWYDYDGLVQVFELDPPRGWSSIEAFHADLIAVLNDRHRFRAQPLDQSLRHGTQTPRGLLGDADPRIRAFIESLNEPIEAYRERSGFDPTHPFRGRNKGRTRLIGCWSVRLGPGGFHVNHVHSEGWLSSAYYVQVPPEISDTERKRGWLKLGEPRFPVPGAAPERFVQPAPGRLVLFPSYMWHGTTPISGGAPRLTIAFDAVTGP